MKTYDMYVDEEVVREQLEELAVLIESSKKTICVTRAGNPIYLLEPVSQLVLDEFEKAKEHTSQ